jgi:hypothetical protein
MKNQIVSNEEILVSNMLEIQAIIRILKKKGITTEDEIMQEIEILNKELQERIKKNSQQN